MKAEQVVQAKKGSHLTMEERRYIATMHDEGVSPYKIGKILGRASNTIRNELKRGTTTIITGYLDKEKYFPDTGQAIYEKNRKKCRMPLKLVTCKEFIEYVEQTVLSSKRSFADVRAEVLARSLFPENEVCSIGTLYAYTDKNMLQVRNIDLPEKVCRKPHHKKRARKHKRLKGTSIEKRPETIDERKEFGHWEIDLVIGKKTKDDNVLLTLTERKTKKEIIRKIHGKTVEAVHRCLKRLKKEIPHFDSVFKSITTDNGTEFSQLYKLGEKLGIDVYYAHPYSSWERGQNENTNRLIRRWVPKGEMIKSYIKKQIQNVESLINGMYRRSLGWKTADDIYQDEVNKLLAAKA